MRGWQLIGQPVVLVINYFISINLSSIASKKNETPREVFFITMSKWPWSCNSKSVQILRRSFIVISFYCIVENQSTKYKIKLMMKTILRSICRPHGDKVADKCISNRLIIIHQGISLDNLIWRWLGAVPELAILIPRTCTEMGTDRIVG